MKEVENSQTSQTQALNIPVVISSVYVIQHKYNLLIHGCFISKKKAEKYTNGNEDYAIIRLAVE